MERNPFDLCGYMMKELCVFRQVVNLNIDNVYVENSFLSRLF